MLPDRDNLKRMLASLDLAIACATRRQPDEDEFRTKLCASVRLLTLEAGEADHDWALAQVEEMLARHSMKDFEL
jgi:hypothetical protein